MKKKRQPYRYRGPSLRVWRTIEGDRLLFSEMSPGHLLNASDHLETRIHHLRFLQEELRREAARQEGKPLSYGEGVAREIQRSAMKRAYANYRPAPRRRPPWL